MAGVRLELGRARTAELGYAGRLRPNPHHRSAVHRARGTGAGLRLRRGRSRVHDGGQMRQYPVFALLALGCSQGPGARAPESEPAPPAASAKESGRRIAPCSIRRAPSRLVENAELSDVVFI